MAQFSCIFVLLQDVIQVEILVRSIYVQQVYCMADQEVYGVRHGFDRSKCLANEGRNSLGHIECGDCKTLGPTHVPMSPRVRTAV